MVLRILLSLACSFSLYAVYAQSDQPKVKWSIIAEQGYGMVIGANGKSQPILCDEGCTSLPSRSEYMTSRVGLLVDLDDKNAIALSVGFIDYKFKREYLDGWLGYHFGDDFNIQYIGTQLTYSRTFLAKNKWTGRGEIGASYQNNNLAGEGIPGRPGTREVVPGNDINTLSLSIGGRMEYVLNPEFSAFTRIVLEQSLRTNLDYIAYTSSLKVKRLAPVYATIGLKLNL